MPDGKFWAAYALLMTKDGFEPTASTACSIFWRMVSGRKALKADGSETVYRIMSCERYISDTQHPALQSLPTMMPM